MEKKPNRWIALLVVVGVLALLAYFAAAFISLFSGSMPSAGNVALISVDGVIMASGSSSPFGESVASSSDIVAFINSAKENPQIKALIFEINSPGGSGVASEEIANAIRSANKTTVSYIREVGASGAYWIASSTDRIFASRVSLTGSIGVISSYLDFAGLLRDYNVTYDRLVSGKYKDMGSPYKPLTGEERQLFQKDLDSVHQYFVETVAKNRHLPVQSVQALATGQVYLGSTALDLGLIDEFGGREEAIHYLENKLNITAQVAEYSTKKGLLDVLLGAFNQNSYSLGLGIGKGLALSTDKPIIWT
ncbi:MAG: signal peptide peptidase SppA [Candidatus Woesearchaeota archaeon]